SAPYSIHMDTTMENNTDLEGAGRDPDSQWARVASDLRAYREAQRRAWGELDEAAIARYLAGESTEEERSHVEQAMQEFPRVRECVEILREIVIDADLSLGDTAVEDGGKSSRPAIPRTPKIQRWWASSARRLAPFALAACLLVAVGLPLLMWVNIH